MKIPIEWIRKWITLRNGKRIPIVDKKTLRALRVYERAEIPLTSLTSLQKKFGKILGVDFNSKFDFPSSSVVKSVVQQQRVVGKLFRGIGLSDLLQKSRFVFYNGNASANRGLSGFYASRLSLTHAGRLESALTQGITSYLSPSTSQFYVRAFSPFWFNRLNEPLAARVKELFRSFDGLVGVANSLPPTRAGTVFSHEMGHALEHILFQSRAERARFNRVYASYLERVLPSLKEKLDEKLNQGLQLHLARGSVLQESSHLLQVTPERIPWISNYSLLNPWEGFSEGFAFYTGTQRKHLERKWPEAVNYFNTLFKGGAL